MQRNLTLLLDIPVRDLVPPHCELPRASEVTQTHLSNSLKPSRPSSINCPRWISQAIRPHRQANTGRVRPRQTLQAPFRLLIRFPHRPQRIQTYSSLQGKAGKPHSTWLLLQYNMGWLPTWSHPGQDRA